MANATVGTMSQTGNAGMVRVKYQGGESEFEVGPDVPVLAYVSADRDLTGRQPRREPSDGRKGRGQAADVKH